MPQGEDEIEPLNATRSGRVHHKILNISTEFSEIQKHEEASEVTKAKALEYLQNNYPPELWCHVYTDGSAKDAARNGGSGVYIKYPDTTSSSHSFAVGKLASNFRAELQVIPEANNILIERNINSNIIILSDCRAALQSLQPEARDEVVEIIFRNLGTGHCRLNAHMHRLKIGSTPLCDCGHRPQTPEHVLMSCPLTERLWIRRSTWPTETILEEKLWGTREELHSTASFIEETSIKVKDLGMRKMTAEEEVVLVSNQAISRTGPKPESDSFTCYHTRDIVGRP